MNNYDLIIVGAGPAGIFTALELLRKSSKTTGPRICLIEKGKPVEKRHCPKDKTGHCVNCKPTWRHHHRAFPVPVRSRRQAVPLLSGWRRAAGADGEDFAQELINYTDKIYLEFGADPHVEGIYEGSEIKEIRKRATQAGLQLVDCPIRHLGTEKAQQLYLNIQNYLLARGVEMLFNTECDNILLEGSECKGVVITEKGERRELRADQVVIATGRRGADWLEKLCAEHNIAHKPGTVDIGVRVECRNEIMETINKVLYEGKLIGYPNPWKNKVRTFCQQPRRLCRSRKTMTMT